MGGLLLRSGRLLLASGLLLGTTVAFLGLVIPGGGLRWYAHAPTAVIGLPLSLALLAAGAVVRRLERSEEARARLRASIDRELRALAAEATPDGRDARQRFDRAL